MKRIHTLVLLLAMGLAMGLDASALTVSFEWDIPGSVKIQTGGLSGPMVDLAPDQTSYTFATSESFGYCYIYATEGYMLVDAAATDGSKTFTPVLPYGKSEKYVGGTMNSACDGKTFKVNCVKVERNDAFTINVVNGLDALTATFSSGYELSLRQGENQYAFNPALDGTLKVALTGATAAYSITLNGTDVARNAYYAYYDNIAIQPGDVLYIRVYETEPKECRLTLQYGEGMEGCLYNIRNVTASSFILPGDIADNTITVKEGTQLYVNLVADDYTYSKITLNGEDITATLANNRVTLTITEQDNTLRIEGAPTVYADIVFTGYVATPEGVEFALAYGGDAIAVGEATPIDADMSILGVTLPAASTRKLSIPVSEKLGQLFFRPTEGYYITTVIVVNPDTNAPEHHGGNASINAAFNGTTFYMVAQKLADPYTATLNVVGTSFVRLAGLSAFSGKWGNPDAPAYDVAPGEATISFLPGYNTPLTAMISDSEASAVFLDGAAVAATANADAATNDYTFTPYYPAADQALTSTITIYADGTNGNADLAFVSLTESDGVTAEFYYSHLRRQANKAGQQLLKGTTLIVRPSTPDCYITYRGDVVHGYRQDGSYVNGLDDNGEYTFAASTNNSANVVAVGMPTPSLLDEHSLATLSGDQATLTVVALDGRVILRNATADAVKSLPAGFYIVNGKKVVVRR